jgi:hypothetical protein
MWVRLGIAGAAERQRRDKRHRRRTAHGFP